MLALLALALFPVVAHAECTTSSCVNYETHEVPTVETKPPVETHKSTSSSHKSSTKPSNNPKAEGSANSSGESTEEPETEPSEGSEGESHKQAGATLSGGNGNPPKGGGGESSKPALEGAKNNDGVGPAEKVAEGGGTATPVAHKAETSSGGGSSPVVPILIAVIVLAAISIGVVLYRQRKSDGQGPDRSVSSPNAS
jgi:cobalamin biosynthesis Mg chelatase CobN